MRPQLNHYHLDPHIIAFSTTRHGGTSTGNYAEFNINRYCGDDERVIEDNRLLLCKELGIAPTHLVYPHQVHQTTIRQITPEFLSLRDDAKEAFIDGVDALMTDVSGICIGVSTADCIPVIIYDPERHAVAVVHAGWRGTVAAIVQKTVETMCRAYNCAPKELRAVIGPGISKKHFEVGDEVYENFLQAGFDMDALAERYPAQTNSDTTATHTYKWHIDLPLCNQMQLLKMGVPDKNIYMSRICTYEQADDYFSARRLGINSGRIFTGAMMKED